MAFVVEIKVTPNSSKKGWVMDKSGGLKCYLKNPAEDGKANAELIKNISKALNITQDRIEIISGATSRSKRIRIDADMTLGKFLELLGIEWQLDMYS
jgi:uncharacterized protein